MFALPVAIETRPWRTGILPFFYLLWQPLPQRIKLQRTAKHMNMGTWPKHFKQSAAIGFASTDIKTLWAKLPPCHTRPILYGRSARTKSTRCTRSSPHPKPVLIFEHTKVGIVQRAHIWLIDIFSVDRAALNNFKCFIELHVTKVSTTPFSLFISDWHKDTKGSTISHFDSQILIFKRWVPSERIANYSLQVCSIYLVWDLKEMSGLETWE